MNAQEKVQLEQFLRQLNSTEVPQKDGEADTLIAASAKQQPDAMYLLVQRAMALEMALQVAQRQLVEMQAKVGEANKPSSGFLDSINSWGRAPTATVRSPQHAAAPVKQSAGPAQPSAWGSGMLGAVATTALGVVAGSMLYQGIQSMMSQGGTPEGSGALDHSSAPSDAGEQFAQNHDLGAADYDADFGGDFDSDGFA